MMKLQHPQDIHGLPTIVVYDKDGFCLGEIGLDERIMHDIFMAYQRRLDIEEIENYTEFVEGFTDAKFDDDDISEAAMIFRESLDNDTSDVELRWKYARDAIDEIIAQKEDEDSGST